MTKKLQRVIDAVIAILAARFTGSLTIELNVNQGGITDAYIQSRRKV